MAYDIKQFITDILRVSRACGEAADADTQVSAFFKEFSRRMPAERSSGNRSFMAMALQYALAEASSQQGILSAHPAPRIEWRQSSHLNGDVNGGGRFRKHLDLLISKPGSSKLVAIEVKSRGFDGIASAVLQCALAFRFGEAFSVAGDGGKPMRQQFTINPADTKFLIVLGDADKRSREIFDIAKELFPRMPVDLKCVFLDTDVRAEPQNVGHVTEAAENLLKAINDHFA